MDVITFAASPALSITSIFILKQQPSLALSLLHTSFFLPSSAITHTKERGTPSPLISAPLFVPAPAALPLPVMAAVVVVAGPLPLPSSTPPPPPRTAAAAPGSAAAAVIVAIQVVAGPLRPPPSPFPPPSAAPAAAPAATPASAAVVVVVPGMSHVFTDTVREPHRVLLDHTHCHHTHDPNSKQIKPNHAPCPLVPAPAIFPRP